MSQKELKFEKQVVPRSGTTTFSFFCSTPEKNSEFAITEIVDALEACDIFSNLKNKY